jgi:hypothetical protein
LSFTVSFFRIVLRSTVNFPLAVLDEFLPATRDWVIGDK